MSRSTREPWGWKVTIYAYGSGERPDGESIIEASELAGNWLGADDFVGTRLDVVQTKPNDQVAS